MENSRHIFIQIDTDSIIALNKQKPSDEEVRAHTIISDQGSLALGNAVTGFTIDVESDQILHFSIMPTKLYTYSKLYFRKFKIHQDKGITIPPTVTPSPHALSFYVQIGNVEKNGSAMFSLDACLETEMGGTIDLCIDPRIQANHGGG